MKLDSDDFTNDVNSIFELYLKKCTIFEKFIEYYSHKQNDYMVNFKKLHKDVNNFKKHQILINNNIELSIQESMKLIKDNNKLLLNLIQKLDVIDYFGVFAEHQKISDNDFNGNSDSRSFQKEFNKVLLREDLYKKYYEYKNYFFKGYENLLKEVLDTDFLFDLCYFNNIEFLAYSPYENRLLFETKDGIKLLTNNHIWTLYEVIGLNSYIFPQLYQFDEFVVFDVGMNRGYSSLKFANFENCYNVFGFEIDDETHRLALENIHINPTLQDKITTYNFGLSDEEGKVDLYCLEGCDGVNTMFPDIPIQKEISTKENNKYIKKVNVKKASNVISEIIDNHNITSNIVLKIDTEGAEYKIINDLIKSKLINKFDLIVGEGHFIDGENFESDLLKFGFKKILVNESQFTYDFAYVKEKYYNKWPLLDR